MAYDSVRFRLAINLIIFLAVLASGTIVFMFIENRSFPGAAVAAEVVGAGAPGLPAVGLDDIS